MVTTIIRSADVPYIRFLVDEPFEWNRQTFAPMAAYSMPLAMADRVGKPYEVMPGSPLRVGARLAAMIRSVGFVLDKTGCCNKCSALETLLNVADEKWIREHLDEIATAIKGNAAEQSIPVPKQMIKAAVRIAVMTERKRLRRQFKKERARMKQSGRGQA